jgi:hypothetical protein
MIDKKRRIEGREERVKDRGYKRDDFEIEE